MSHNITIGGGTSVRLPTAGKYCDQDIIVTATGGGGNTSIEDGLVTRSLTSYSNDRVTSVGLSAFQNHTGLLSVDFPNATTIGSNAFNGCTDLVDINLPKVKSIPMMAFYNCKAVTLLDFPCATNLATQSLRNCAALKHLILRSNTVCAMAHTLALDGTPMANGGAGIYVYVPRTLVESYKVASNWKTYYGYGTCVFRAIEDYPDICNP